MYKSSFEFNSPKTSQNLLFASKIAFASLLTDALYLIINQN
jgi:hypothetical protein